MHRLKVDTSYFRSAKTKEPLRILQLLSSMQLSLELSLYVFCLFLLLCSLSPDTQSLMRRLGSAHCNCAPVLHSTPLLIRPKTLLLLRSPSRLPNHPAIRSALPLTPIHPFTLFLAPLAKHGLLSIPGTSPPIRIKQIQLEQVCLSPSPYPFP